MNSTEQKAREIAAKAFWKESGYDMGATKALIAFSDIENRTQRAEISRLFDVLNQISNYEGHDFVEFVCNIVELTLAEQKAQTINKPESGV